MAVKVIFTWKVIVNYNFKQKTMALLHAIRLSKIYVKTVPCHSKTMVKKATKEPCVIESKIQKNSYNTKPKDH